MKTHTRLTIAAAAVAATLLVGPASTRARMHLLPHPGSPEQFIKDAATGGMAEVELGKLASERAASSEVKDFGKRMVQDHGKANDELKRIAAQKKVALPSGLDAEHQDTYDRLSRLSGDEFDRTYMSEMLKDHRADAAEFKKATESKDPEVKAFASRTLPVIQEHLEMAEQMAEGTRPKY